MRTEQDAQIARRDAYLVKADEGRQSVASAPTQFERARWQDIAAYFEYMARQGIQKLH
jgi:hypothetical protein